MPIRQLGQLEAKIMQRIWEWDRPVKVRDVLADLQTEKPVAYTTVMTVMDTLFRKGLLQRELEGRAYSYRPSHTREQYTARYMEEVMSDGGDLETTLLHFVEQLPAVEVARLRDAIARLEGGEAFP